MLESNNRLLINALIFLFQLIFTFAITFSLYMMMAIIDYDGGFDNFVGLALFQPILGVILCSITIFVCFIVGLPIRLNRKINKWWSTHFIVSISGFIAGLVCLILSVMPMYRVHGFITIDGIERHKDIPNTFLSMTGFFLVAFCALHIYPPRLIRNFINRFV